MFIKSGKNGKVPCPAVANIQQDLILYVKKNQTHLLQSTNLPPFLVNDKSIYELKNCLKITFFMSYYQEVLGLYAHFHISVFMRLH